MVACTKNTSCTGNTGERPTGRAVATAFDIHLRHELSGGGGVAVSAVVNEAAPAAPMAATATPDGNNRSLMALTGVLFVDTTEPNRRGLRSSHDPVHFVDAFASGIANLSSANSAYSCQYHWQIGRRCLSSISIRPEVTCRRGELRFLDHDERPRELFRIQSSSSSPNSPALERHRITKPPTAHCGTGNTRITPATNPRHQPCEGRGQVID
jgi:hypothetical protein